MALKKSVWYHVGSAAAGSLIIAIVKTIRYVIAKIQYYCEKNMVDPYKKVRSRNTLTRIPYSYLLKKGAVF